MEMYISEAAVVRLLDNHERFVKHAYMFCREWNTAEDIVQEAYMKVIRSATTEKGLKGYMRHAIRSVFIDMQRTKAKKSALNAANESDIKIESLDQLAGREYNPGSEELSDPVAKALNGIPEMHTLVFFDYLAGFSSAQIGRMRNLVPGTVNTRICRAKKLLREKLEKEYC